MVRSVPLILLAFFFSVSHLFGHNYTFKLGGKPVEAHFKTVSGKTGEPGVGDLVQVGGFRFVLDEPGEYDLVSEAGVLARRRPDGTSTPIAVAIDMDWSKSTKENSDQEKRRRIVNPLTRLSAGEKAGLRGIRAEVWSPEVEQSFEGISGENLVIELDFSGNVSRVGKLPAKLWFLTVSQRNSEEKIDSGFLTSLKKLRSLEWHAESTALDGRMIAGALSLRQLSLSFSKVENMDAIAALPALVHLSISYCEDVQALPEFPGSAPLEILHLRGSQLLDLSVLRNASRLRELNLTASKVSDLTPLGSHPTLEVIDASGAGVSKLPEKALPKLRRISLLSAPVTAEARAAFAVVNPKTQIVASWREALVNELNGATRVRVRSGGLCHRNISEETTLAELNDPAEIAKLIEGVHFNDAGSSFHCMCCGNPTIEFYRGTALTAALGFHHGRSLRWEGGDWPGDALLTTEGGEFLCNWLATHGVRGPKLEFEESRQRERAARRRGDVLRKILPEELQEQLSKIGETEDLTQDEMTQKMGEVLLGTEDQAPRTVLLLRLLGADESNWNYSDMLVSSIVEGALPKVSNANLVQALTDIADGKDGDALNGAGSWLFEHGAIERLDAGQLAKVLPAISRHALAHPRDHNRLRAVQTLAGLDAPFATELLRNVIQKKLKVRQLGDDATVEPPGMVTYRPQPKEFPEGASEEALAAWRLAKLGDKQSEATIRAMAQSCSESDKPALEEALKALGARR